jgi:ribosomal protein L11
LLIFNFTIEEEVNNTIHFLDLTVSKNKKFSFRVYQKPTATVIIISKDSNYPPEQKTAAIRYLTTRLTT